MDEIIDIGNDVIILVPGILGSVLQHDKEGDIWAVSGKALLNLAKSRLEKLKLREDDCEQNDLGDGITATGLIQYPSFVAGLMKIDAYTAIAKRIQEKFNVSLGKNYFEFPYDWRRDNRVSASKLKDFIDKHLNEWRKSKGDENAKVILIAHSMGGLVCSYYLEVLKGWTNCKALITLGTPYRGSVKALNYIANGYKQWNIDLTDVMRSFTSVYQLLPIYEMLNVEGEYQRIAKTKTSNIPHLDIKKARNALKFHREIERYQKRHAKNTEYKDNFSIICCVGKTQKTYQSAQLLKNGELKPSWELPPKISEKHPLMFNSGDGTVPRVSAIPSSLDSKLIFNIAETHSSLPKNDSVLINLINSIENLYMPATNDIRGDDGTITISVELDDLYLKNQEPVKIQAQVEGNLLPKIKDGLKLEARIELVDSSIEPERIPFDKKGDEWSLTTNDLEPGLYRLTVQTSQSQRGGIYPTPVHDLFLVV